MGNRTDVLAEALGWWPQPGRTGRIVGSWGWIPHLSAGVRSGSKALSYIGLAQGSTPPPILKPQLLSVGAFSCLFAPVPACCWGFLRKPADFASRPNWPFRATFHSLLAIPRSDLAPWNWPEVRKGRNAGPYRSEGYARTNQAVGLQHWLGHGINEDRLTCPLWHCKCASTVHMPLGATRIRMVPGAGRNTRAWRRNT